MTLLWFFCSLKLGDGSGVLVPGLKGLGFFCERSIILLWMKKHIRGNRKKGGLDMRHFAGGAGPAAALLTETLAST